MPIYGERKQKILGRGFENDPLKQYVEEFSKTLTNVMTECTVDYFREPSLAFMNPSGKEALRKFFVEGSWDEKDPRYKDPNVLQDHKEQMNALFENTIQAINEHTPIGSFNPIQGITVPIYKNTLMNMVFDKGAIPKAVAVSPKFTRTMENRFLIDKDGNKIDMFREQEKMYPAMKATNPVTDIEMTLTAGQGTFDSIIHDNLNGSAKYDSLDISSYISEVYFENTYKQGQIKPDGNTVEGPSDETVNTWQRVELRFKPGYGEEQRQLIESIMVPVHDKEADKTTMTKVTVYGTINDNVVNIVTSPANIVTKVKFRAKLDASNARLQTCTVKWEQVTEIVEIGTSEPISTTVSPEEIKDISALYNVNQLTKIMSLTKTAMAEYKDRDIKNELDDSYDVLPSTDKFYGKFDYAPREGYMLDHIEWRQRTFWDWFETQITAMLQVLNDPNMTVSIFGDPDLIRKITPTTVDYTTPSNIGPVELDYSRTAFTSNKRHYTFVGSDKLRWSDQLIVILCPRGTDRITYVIYDYQMYFGNEIRQNNNPALPALHAFQRYKFSSYQPVQARVQIVNPSGLRPEESANVPFVNYTVTH